MAVSLDVFALVETVDFRDIGEEVRWAWVHSVDAMANLRKEVVEQAQNSLE